MTGSGVSTARVALPVGAVVDGAAVRTADVRGLTGRDEEWLAAGGADLPGAARATALLARVVERLGDAPGPPTTARLRGLAVGDRETLLWAARRVTAGPRLDLVLDCADCGAKLDAVLDLDAVLPAAPANGRVVDDAPRDPLAPVEVAVGGRTATVRRPTGADQEAVAALEGAEDPVAALLRRVVATVDGEAPSDALLDELAAPVAATLAALDPAAEVLLDVVCVHCGATTAAVADAGAVLAEEGAAGARWLVEEVHAIAWHYHWSEQEILALPLARRRRYLDLIDETLSGGGG